MRRSPPLRLTLILIACCSCSALVTKTGSAYQNLVVAVHDSVPQDSKYIEAIKDLVQRTSKALFNSTDGAAYFDAVTIALPKTWIATGNVVYKNHFPTAEVRIQLPAPGETQIAAPSTFQPGGCGEPGQYIQVSTDFLTSSNSTTMELFGPKERLMVHEWAHFRFGVFDEYGIPGHDQFPLFYFNDGFMEVSSCPDGVRGWIESSMGSICEVFNDKVSKDCIFIPDRSDDSSDTSLMSIPSLDSVRKFCNGPGTKRPHNWRAPTKQNALCQGRSTWDVISQHPDFKSQGKTTYREPTFTVVRHQELPPRYVLVLDDSGSMGNSNGAPLRILKQASSTFVADLQEGSYLGLVAFNSRSSTLLPLAPVTNATRSAALIRIQGIRAGGGTSIGAGLREALQVLRIGNKTSIGARIILVTDGLEESRPYIANVRKEVLDSQAQVYTVALGKKAAPELEKLALDTQGKSFFFQNIEGNSTADLNQIFLAASTAQGDIDVASVEMANGQLPLGGNVIVKSVVIDNELGKNSMFAVSSPDILLVDFQLVSPNGKKYNSSSPEFILDKDMTKRALYRIGLAEPGIWNMTMKTKGGKQTTVDLSAQSEPRDPDLKPIRVRAWINATLIRC